MKDSITPPVFINNTIWATEADIKEDDSDDSESQEFDGEDVIFPVMFNLLTNLDRDVMGVH